MALVEEKIPDLRSVLQPRRKDEGREVLEEFVNSNKNNPTKSRIPSVYGMTIFQMLGAWSSNSKEIKIQVRGEERTFKRNVQGMTELFKMLYDENAISAGGKSREELSVAALGFFLQDIGDVKAAQETRVGEGVKKKK